MKLNLYSVSDKYIKYLRQFDEKIYDNKEDIRTQTRKYLGIVLTVNDFNYYIPMSSPKKSDYIDYEKKIIRRFKRCYENKKCKQEERSSKG